MSSAEVICWGARSPASSNAEHPTPLEAGRASLVQRLYAGFGSLVLAGSRHLEWVPCRPGLEPDNKDVIGKEGGNDSSCGWSCSGVESAAVGQQHTLLVRRVTAINNCEDVSSETQVLAWGSGPHGQVCLKFEVRSLTLAANFLSRSPA